MEQQQIRIYTDGVLTMETLFRLDGEAGFTGYQETLYHKDGSRTVNEYNDLWELTSTAVYVSDGSVISTEAAGAEF